MPGVIIAAIAALGVSSLFSRRQKKKASKSPLAPEDERKMTAQPESDKRILPGLEPNEVEQMLRKMHPEHEKTDEAPAQTAADEALAQRVVDYYTGMWNGMDGTLFTDPAMTIDRFGFRLTADHLTDTVWLEGSTQPLISDTAYSALPGQSQVVRLEDGQYAPLYKRVKDALLQLGTVRCRNMLFYPIHTAPEHDPKADLEAQVQELLKAKKEKAVG